MGGRHDGLHLLALWLAVLAGWMTGEDVEVTIGYVVLVSLFGLAARAADHGLVEIDNLGPYAIPAINKITRLRRNHR